MRPNQWSFPDETALALIDHANDTLGSGWAPTVTVVELDKVRHTWANCPFGGDDAVTTAQGAALTMHVSLHELARIADCSACTVQMRPDGGVSRWIRRQLAPVAALHENDPGIALALCHPTDMVAAPQVAHLLDLLRGRFHLKPHLEGPVRLVTRSVGMPIIGLASGVHGAEGHSVIPAGEAAVGSIIGVASRESGVSVAEAFLALHRRFRGPAEAWETLSAALGGAASDAA